MRVAIATHGRFHSFDLARELAKKGAFAGIWSPYPAFKLANEGLPPGTLHAGSALTYVRHALDRLPKVPKGALDALEWQRSLALDRRVRREMPADADALVALSMGGLGAGRAMRARGGVYFCDRGSTHCRFQDETLVEEYARYGLTFEREPARKFEREEAEYAEADAILVPTSYVKRTFVERGVSEAKVKKAPYGVNLQQFYPDGTPPDDSFEVLFVGAQSVRKGMRYLFEAFERFDHPRKRLTLVGAPNAETADLVAKALETGKVVATGPVSRDQVREHMSRSHVMVLASVEEGLALVQAQALACGLPVIASPPTGCEDLYTDGQEGFIVPMRDPAAIADRLTELADRPDLRRAMGTAAIERVKSLGGWERYGDLVYGYLEEALAARKG